MLLQTIYGIEALAAEDHLGFLADIFNSEMKKVQVKRALNSLIQIEKEHKVAKAITKLTQVLDKIERGESPKPKAA
jgi:hypothetical protein